MSNHHIGNAVIMRQILDEMINRIPGHRIQPRVRLVIKDTTRLSHHRPCQSHPLAHPSRKISGHLVLLTFQTDNFEGLTHPTGQLVGIHDPGLLQRKSNILRDRHRVKQGPALKHHADLFPGPT